MLRRPAVVSFEYVTMVIVLCSFRNVLHVLCKRPTQNICALDFRQYYNSNVHKCNNTVAVEVGSMSACVCVLFVVCLLREKAQKKINLCVRDLYPWNEN